MRENIRINELETKISLTEQKIYALKSKIGDCISNLNNNQRMINNYSNQLQVEKLEHTRLLSSSSLLEKGTLKENRFARERNTHHWRYMNHLESKVINLEVVIANLRQEKNNTESEIDSLKSEQKQNIMKFNQIKSSFSAISHAANCEERYVNRPGTSRSNRM